MLSRGLCANASRVNRTHRRRTLAVTQTTRTKINWGAPLKQQLEMRKDNSKVSYFIYQWLFGEKVEYNKRDDLWKPHVPPQVLISEVPPIVVNSKIASCDGGGGPLGHPRVFMRIDRLPMGRESHDHKINKCDYCGLRFVNAKLLAQDLEAGIDWKENVDYIFPSQLDAFLLAKREKEDPLEVTTDYLQIKREISEESIAAQKLLEQQEEKKEQETAS